MIDFKQMTDDEQTAMAACEEWSNGEPAVTTQEEELSFKEEEREEAGSFFELERAANQRL